MLKKYKQLSVAIILASLTALNTWQIARAYVVYGGWLSSTQSYTLSGFPSGWSSHMIASADTWTAVTSSPFTWQNVSSGGWSVSYGYIDGPLGIAGQTLVLPPGVIVFMSLTMDNSENWYVGTGVPPSNSTDVRSIATHEFGHGLGLAHTGGIYCPGNTNNATMCLGYPLGSYWARTLEGDDRNGLRYLYP